MDATALATRGFFAVPARMVTSGGLHTNALFALCQACRRVLVGKSPSHAVAVFEPPGVVRGVPGRSPPAWPIELRVQRPWFEPVLRAHGFAAHHPERPALEAIAALVDAALADGAEVRVVSPDRQLVQLVSDRVRVDDPLKEVVWDTEAVVRRYGVAPAKLPDLWALVGDDALHLPGVVGIGPKRAVALLADGDAAAVDPDAGDLAERVRLVPEPIAADWGRWVFAPPSADGLNDLYRELELFQLLAAQAPPAPPAYFVADTPDVAAAALGEIAGTDTPVALQLLVDGPAGAGGITGIAVAIRPGRAVYFPFEGPEPALGAPGLDALGRWLADPGRPKVLHDARVAFAALGARGIALDGVVGDTALASFRVDPSARLPHDLDQVARAFLHRAVQGERTVIGQGDAARPWRSLPIGRAGAWACHAADAVVALWPVLARRLAALDQAAALEREDLPLARAIGRMERHGIAVDRAALDRLGAAYGALRRQVEAAIDAAAGRPVKPGSPRDVGALLFEELGLPVLRRTKTGYRTDADVLDRLATRHPVVPLLLRWRTLSQLERTWARGLPAHVHPATGRIHSTVQLTASGNGQLVNAAPDLQRVPGRTDEGARLRACFRAPPGHVIVAADWSQLELRLLAHLSDDPVLVAAFRAGDDVHARTAAAIGADRETGKMVNFATLYGQGATSLGIVLGRPKDEAAAIIARFDATYAIARAWQAGVRARGIERGVAFSLTGRRRVLHELGAKEPAMRALGERLAANFPVQGTAADLARLAIRDLDAALRGAGLAARVVLAIVDELLIEVPEAEVDAALPLIRRTMEEALPLSVPLVVRVGVGQTWAAASAAR